VVRQFENGGLAMQWLNAYIRFTFPGFVWAAHFAVLFVSVELPLLIRDGKLAASITFGIVDAVLIASLIFWWRRRTSN
jgi:hypothetical protein